MISGARRLNHVLERVARAIYEQQGALAGDIHPRSWTRLRPRVRDAYIAMASAAIRALHPASPAMVEAAKDSGAGGESEDISADFKAMLSAAL